MHEKNPAKETESIEIGYLRAPMGLEKLCVRTLHIFEADERSQTTLDELEPFVALQRTPLLSPRSDSRAKALLAAWEALSGVRAPDAHAAAALWTVLTQTVPAAHAPAPRPLPFAALAAPEPPKASAAHPRAFQGTTHQPPTSKTPPPTDPRPFLCDRAATLELIARFSSETPQSESRDWNALYDGLRPELSPVFIATLFPILREKPWPDIAAAHALFQRTGLERHAPLLACIAALFARSEHAPAWCEMVAQLPPDQQAGFGGLLLDTNACDADPGAGGEGFGDIILETLDGPSPAYRVYCLLRGLTHGVDPRYLTDGFRLNDRLKGSWNFHDVKTSGSVPIKALNAVLDTIEDITYDDEWKIRSVWKACGTLVGCADLIDGRDWSRWRSDIAVELLRIYAQSASHESAMEAQVKWKAIHSGANTIETTLERIAPEYQWKFVENLQSFLWQTEPEDLKAHSLPDACALLHRLCQPPFHPRRNLAHVWLDYIAYFDAEQRAKLIAAPDACYQQMEKSCRTKNTASLIGAGGMSFAKGMPAFTLACFLSATTHFFRTAKVLGCLSDEEGLATAQSFARESFLNADLENGSDAELYPWIAARSEPALVKVIPKELQAHYEGAAVLSTPRLSHYHAQMRRQWLRACLGTLENGIYDRLARGFTFGEMDDDVRHTLQMQRIAEKNRKPLKKLLSAHWSGRSHYLINHPLTQKWLKEHPNLDIDLWISGILRTRTIAPWGEVTVTLEQDLIEALKLGTYVGSCLGLGGLCAYSAAATVLDINKQVLYARDTKGMVVGRQVVGYAADGKVVCFPVYPLSAPAAIRALFHDYDKEFAAALGTSVIKASGEESYTVEFIISNTWWNDDYDPHAYDKPEKSVR